MAVPGLLALFFLSGVSGLLYEVVWLRILVRAFGCTAFATSNVLAVFMGGLAAGAWMAGRRAKSLPSPLKGYAAVEAGLAVAACLATWGAARLPEVVAAWGAASPVVSAILRSMLSAAVLLVPTLLMGASLPLLTEHLSRTRGSGPAGPTRGAAAPTTRGSGADRPALLYGVNALGAVAGVLFSGFYCLGAWGETRTVALGAALNLAVGAAALALSRGSSAPASPAGAAAQGSAAPPELSPAFVCWAMAASGFCALALEVLWTRALVLLLGNSIYAFSAMLACYLVGIALGSLAGAAALRSARQAARSFAGLQAVAGCLVAASFEVYYRLGLAHSAPAYLYSPLSGVGDFAALFVSAIGVVLPVTFVYGILFPVAAKVCDEAGGGEGVARVYGFNTVGSVLGSLACAFVLIPWLGGRGALYAIALLHVAIAAAAALAPPGRRGSGAPTRGSGAPTRGSGAPTRGWGFPAFAAVVVATLAATRPDPFYEIVRARLARRAPGVITFHREGPSSTVTGFAGERETLLLINGIIVSGKGDLGRMMAHLPLILQPAPKKALVICLGAGNTFRAAVDHGVDVDLVELEPEVVQSFSDLWPDHAAYLRNPRARVQVNDGRNALLTTRERYDLIVIDGTPPIFSAGTVNLYSREFVQLALSRLTPAGILALWVPLPCFASEFWMIARNFVDAFPSTLAWGQPTGGINGVLLLGSPSAIELDPAALLRRAAERKLAAANPWLNPRLLDPSQVVPDADLRAEAARYPAVTDDRPYTEFPLERFLRREPLQKGPEFVLAIRAPTPSVQPRRAW